MQFGLDQDPDEVTRQLTDLVARAPVDEVMLFYFAEEYNDGHEPLTRVRQWIEHSRPFRQALRDAGVAVSLNPWHTLLHFDRHRVLKPEQPWQLMVDPRGRVASAQVCPLCSKWREYYAQQMALYATEGFRVVWVDDDFRFHNHAPLEWGGCFCPLHVAEFNRRAGTSASRDEIVANCTAPGQPHPWREIWLDMWDDTQLKLIAQWREILAAGGTRLGLMSSTPEMHAAEGRRWDKWWAALGGDASPVHRPHFCSYGQTLGRSITTFIATLDQNRQLQPTDIESGPEIDSGPYGPWNKPYRETAAQMALAHVMGATNLNISLFDFMGNRMADEPERVRFLSEWRPVCDWLADAFGMSLRSVGVGVPWSQDVGRTIRTNGSGRWSSLVCPTRGWAQWLLAAGVATSMRSSEHVNALAGDVAWAFSDAQIQQWLTGGLLLDGHAAHILIQRGFGERIGFTAGRLITQADALYSIERCTEADFALRPGAMISVNYHAPSAMFQGQPVAEATVASVLLDPTCRVVGHGLTVFENPLGGRVAVVPWDANIEPKMFTQRAAQLRATLRFLERGSHCGSVEGGAWLVPQFLTDGTTWRGVVWNGSADECRQFALQLPSDMPAPRSLVQVDAHGERTNARLDGSRVMLDHPLYEWEFVVLL
jgi:hypothetical protein